MRFNYITDTAGARLWVTELVKHGHLGIDIETAPLPEFSDDKKAGLDPFKSRPRLFQAASLDGHVAVFDLDKVSLDILNPLLDCEWYTFNGMFEYQHLTHAGMTVPRLHDVMLMDQLINRKMEHGRGLGVVAGIPKEQQVSDWSGELSAEQIQYAAVDALATRRLADKFTGQYPTQVYNLWRSAIPQLGNAGLNGQGFNWDAHAELASTWATGLDKQKALLEITMPGINPNSVKQINEWLLKNVDEAILIDWPVTPTGSFQTGKDILAKYPCIPCITPLYKYKKLQKLEGTYGNKYTKYRHPVTGRLHGTYRLGMTKTGRLTCSNPNTQQVPRDNRFRELFIADPGYVLVSADYSQVELRVAAILSGDKAMISAYENGIDLHALTASRVSGIPLDKVTAKQRQGAKAVNFGLLFGQQPRGLVSYAKTAYGVNMSVPEARAAQSVFYQSYMGLSAWQESQRQLAAEAGRVTTRMGLIRDFHAMPGNVRSQCINAPIQGSAAEAMLASIIHLPLDMYATVHDELTVMVKKEDAQQAATELETAMVKGFLQVFPDGERLLNGLVEVKIGDNWAEVH